jgi:hypothetical protein
LSFTTASAETSMKRCGYFKVFKQVDYVQQTGSQVKKHYKYLGGS